MNLLPPLLSRFRLPALLAATALVSACGPGHVSNVQLGAGGGGGFGGGSSASQYAQQCSAANPYRADAQEATRSGSLTIEKQWARAYINEAYLWYDKVPAISASAPAYSDDTAEGYYPSIDGYFNDLTVDALPEDRFSFTYPTRLWKELSESGVSLGYGIEFYRDSATPPRGIRIAYVEPVSPAATAGLRRGDTLVSADGVAVDDTTTTGAATLNEALSPATSATHTFVFSRNGLALPPTTLAATSVTLTPVPQSRVITVGTSRVGYVVFNDHVLTAEAQLRDAMADLRGQSVSDLVLDLRYNRGGYLFIASQVAYMVAGATRTANQTFERLRYNDKRTSDTNRATTPFFSAMRDGITTLPSLNLSRVYVLTGAGTCSASEAIINGLRGIDVEVILVGGTTCGKPYGFTAKDNCGVSYFPIEFQGVNAKGFGDYTAGFAATCPADDDFDHDLGDTAERLLATALNHRATGVCLVTGLGKARAPTGGLVPRPERGGRYVESR